MFQNGDTSLPAATMIGLCVASCTSYRCAGDRSRQTPTPPFDGPERPFARAAPRLPQLRPPENRRFYRGDNPGDGRCGRMGRPARTAAACKRTKGTTYQSAAGKHDSNRTRGQDNAGVGVRTNRPTMVASYSTRHFFRVNYAAPLLGLLA